MDLKLISEIANSEMVFAVLFIAGLIIIGRWFFNNIREQKEENRLRETQIVDLYEKQQDRSYTREGELMTHLKKNTEQLENIADTLSDVQKSFGKLENNVNDNLKDVWKELGGKADKQAQ